MLVLTRLSLYGHLSVMFRILTDVMRRDAYLNTHAYSLRYSRRIYAITHIFAHRASIHNCNISFVHLHYLFPSYK